MNPYEVSSIAATVTSVLIWRRLAIREENATVFRARTCAKTRTRELGTSLPGCTARQIFANLPFRICVDAIPISRNEWSEMLRKPRYTIGYTRPRKSRSHPRVYVGTHWSKRSEASFSSTDHTYAVRPLALLHRCCLHPKHPLVAHPCSKAKAPPRQANTVEKILTKGTGSTKHSAVNAETTLLRSVEAVNVPQDSLFRFRILYRRWEHALLIKGWQQRPIDITATNLSSLKTTQLPIIPVGNTGTPDPNPLQTSLLVSMTMHPGFLAFVNLLL